TSISQPALILLTSSAMMNGIIHSITTSRETSTGVASEVFLYSSILFASSFNIEFYIFLHKKVSSVHQLDLSDEHYSLPHFKCLWLKGLRLLPSTFLYTK